MGHTHEHTHEQDTDTYYLDQLCMIAITGAFAGVCLTLYFWRTDMLKLMLAPSFFKFVLWSGLALLVLVVVRSIMLWQQVGRAQPVHSHEHACDHDHDHDHGHAHHHAYEHDHGTSVSLAESPVHTHEHLHSDSCCGHDHGWAPWRYVVLLLPIMLYLLGLPSDPPSVSGASVALDVTEDAHLSAMLVGAGTMPFGALPPAWALAADHAAGPARIVGLKELEQAAYEPGIRKQWQGKYVRVVGQLNPSSRNDRIFEVVRYRIQCCAADAIRIGVPALCRDSMAGAQPGEWVEVTGRVMFTETRPGTFITILQVPHRKNVSPTQADPNPYLQ
jgi:uncharacterized membrane protein YcgQ (UPF0703/DUF1980 family)